MAILVVEFQAQGYKICKIWTSSEVKLTYYIWKIMKQKKIIFVGPALFHFKKYHNFLWICSLSIGKKICLILFPGTWNTTTGIAIKHVIMHDKLGGTQNIGQGKGRKKSQKERICRHPQLGRKIITLCLKFFFWHPIPTAFWRLWS